MYPDAEFNGESESETVVIISLAVVECAYLDRCNMTPIGILWAKHVYDSHSMSFQYWRSIDEDN